jgi:hypothetical protein
MVPYSISTVLKCYGSGTLDFFTHFSSQAGPSVRGPIASAAAIQLLRLRQLSRNRETFFKCQFLANLDLACHLNPLTEFRISVRMAGVFWIRIGIYKVQLRIRIQDSISQFGPRSGSRGPVRIHADPDPDQPLPSQLKKGCNFTFHLSGQDVVGW